MKISERWDEETECAKSANHIALMQLFAKADDDRRKTLGALDAVCGMHSDDAPIVCAIRALETVSMKALELAEKICTRDA